MAIGQIVYGLEDYAGSGGILYTDIKTKQPMLSSNGNLNKIDIFTDVFSQIGVTGVTKIGIQAPPGTRFQINTTVVNNIDDESSQATPTDIMMGRTGVYEIEVPNMNVNSLFFNKIKRYVLDIDKTNYAIDNGMRLMREAKIEFESFLSEFEELFDAAQESDSNNAFWQEYEKRHDEYVKAYEEGRAVYIQGQAGVYTHSTDSDLKNIIIDFTYETMEENA